MKKAFTLAEVLITLAIIGIVAALTIPTIVSKYQKMVIENGLKKTYAELQQWLIRAEADNGPYTTWDYTQGSIVEKYFEPYIHLTPCGKYAQKSSVRCMVDNGSFSTWYKPTRTASPGELETGAQYMPKYYADDGRVFGFLKQYYADWATPGISLNIVVDVNGSRGKSIMGQDVFVFSLCNFRGITNRIKPGPAESWSENNDTETLLEKCPDTIPYVIWKGAACIHLLERNNWKFPKNYPIKF